MYAIFTYIYHESKPKCRYEYTIPGAFGNFPMNVPTFSIMSEAFNEATNPDALRLDQRLDRDMDLSGFPLQVAGGKKTTSLVAKYC